MAASPLAILLLQAQPAAAGASWLQPARNRSEPGEMVTIVGFTGGGAFGWVEDGPFFGYLLEADDDGVPVEGGFRLDVGELTVAETGRGGYLTLRASISFVLPLDIAPGIYAFDYCNAGCTQRLGDLLGGNVNVGVDPEFPISREWPLDDPEIENLAPDALLAGPGFEISAGEVRAGVFDIDPLTGLPALQREPDATEEPDTQAVVSTPASGVPDRAGTDDDANAAPVATKAIGGEGGSTSTLLFVLTGAAVLGAGALGAGAVLRRRPRR